MEFDQSYFANYCGRGDYSQHFLRFSSIQAALGLIEQNVIPKGRVCVLGAATGEVLSYIYNRSGIMPAGCEISPWAYRRIPRDLRVQVQCADMRDYLKKAAEAQQQFALIYSNSLFYLPEIGLTKVLGSCRRLSPRVFFEPEPFPDRRVKLDQPYEWWQERFADNGYGVHPRHRHLWVRKDAFCDGSSERKS